MQDAGTTDNSDVKFSIQIGSDWTQMGQIWDFFRSDSENFGDLKKNQICPILGQSDPIGSQNLLKLIWKSPKFVPFWPNLVANLTWVILCTQRDHLWFAHGLLTGNNCEQTMSWVDEYWGQQGGHNSAHSGSNVTEWQAYKSGTCSVSHNVLKSKFKKSQICPIWFQSEPLCA